MKDETLDLIYRMTRKAEIVVKIPFGDTDLFFTDKVAK